MAAVQKQKKSAGKAKMVGVSKSQAVQFLSGLFTGLIKEDHLANIQACMADEPEVATQVSAALTDFEKRDLDGILNGIKAIGDLLPSLPKDVKDCRAVKSDFARIGRWAAILEDPK